MPALTGALVELCHEQPEDPVGQTGEGGVREFGHGIFVGRETGKHVNP